MADLFGYTKSGNAIGQVASNEFATVNVGGKLALAQSVNMDYTQRIDEVRALGDSNIYWVPGRASGNITIAKLPASVYKAPLKPSHSSNPAPKKKPTPLSVFLEPVRIATHLNNPC